MPNLIFTEASSIVQAALDEVLRNGIVDEGYSNDTQLFLSSGANTLVLYGSGFAWSDDRVLTAGTITGFILWQWHPASASFLELATGSEYNSGYADVQAILAAYDAGASQETIDGLIRAALLPGPMLIEGSSDDDALLGSPFNDELNGGGGNDSVDGGDGDDTAVFSGAGTDYVVTVTVPAGTITVTDLRAGSPDRTDTLVNVEHLIFRGDFPPVAADDFPSIDGANNSTADAANGVLANDTDPDGGTLTVVAVNGSAANVGQPIAGMFGTLTVNADGSYTFAGQEPGSFQVFQDFTYTVSDGQGNESIATIHVTSFVQPPSVPIDVDGFLNVVVLGAAAGTPIGLTAFATDPNGGTVSYSLTDDAGGRFAIDPVTGVVTQQAPDYGSPITVRATASSGAYSEADFGIGGPFSAGTVRIRGTSGPDLIDATHTPPGQPLPTDGFDLIEGGAGDDVLDGGLGNDDIYGGPGSDVASYEAAAGSISADLDELTATGAAGTDFIHSIEGIYGSDFDDAVAGNSVANTFRGNGGNDLLDGRGGLDTADYQLAPAAVIVDLTTGTASGGDDNDTLTSIENVTGSAFNDTLTGNTLANTIAGGAGNDVISGGGASDVLAGGAGDDTIDGGLAGDTVTYAGADGPVFVNLGLGQATGADGNDTILNVENVTGSAYADTLVGKPTGVNDIIEGGLGDDLIDGAGGTGDIASYANASGAVTVNLVTGSASGADGNDTLANINTVRGSAFDDVITGDAGNNTIRGGNGNDTMDGGAGFDLAEYSGGSGVTVSLVSGTATGNAGSDTLIGFEGILGSGSADTLTGDGGDNTITGGGGNDNINGGGGNDTLSGNLGNDTINGGTGIDTVTYAIASGAVTVNLNTSTATGADGTDTLSNLENVIGSAFADTLTGNGGDNVLTGGGGNDILRGNPGTDTAAYSGNRSDYSVSALPGGSYTVTDLRAGSPNGSDTLTDIEFLAFADQTVATNQPPSAPTDADGAPDRVTEGAASGTAVGIMASAFDPEGGAVTFALSDSAGGRFAIDPVTGVVTVADGSLLDYETAASHDITVTATDPGGEVAAQDFTVAVANAPPSFPVDGDAGANHFAEGAATGAPVGITAIAGDANGGTVTFSLEDDAGGRFAIDADTGVVSVADGGLLDYETATSHGITVKAADSSGDFVTAAFTIDVTNVAPAAPVDGDPADDRVVEGAPAGTRVGITALAADPSGGPVAYSLSDDAGGHFAIDPETGVVTVAAVSLLDYETATSHAIIVQATDPSGAYSTQSFTVAVENAAPVAVDVDPNANSVMEGSANGTAVGITVQAADPNGGPATFSLAWDGGSRFAIDPVTGVVTIKNGYLFDYDEAQSYSFVIATTDAQGAYSETSFFVDVIQRTSGVTINGTEARDFIAATSTPPGQPFPTDFGDTINGLGGDDIIIALAGDDVVNGGEGIDEIWGEGGNDTLNGDAGDDILLGGLGDDTLEGGEGSDTASYYTAIQSIFVNMTLAQNQATGDAIGTDQLIGVENVMGSASHDAITGDAGNNVIEGYIGHDLLAGGDGIDTASYLHADSAVNVDLSRTNFQNTLGAGFDRLSGFENLTGSTFDDTLKGDANVNTLRGLSGHDLLEGGGGADILVGGSGDDTYIVDALDIIDETVPNDGADTVRSSKTYSLGSPQVLGNVENLTLTGDNNISGTGNALGNVLTGNSGNNVLDSGDGNDLVLGGSGGDTLRGGAGEDNLDGGSGSDTMIGGLGSDSYIVDSSGDVVDEIGGDGAFDWVQSSRTFSLADTSQVRGDVELLTLLGTGNINGTGNALANIITGNSGNNVLAGLDGADQLHGGGGTDTASYAASSAAVDVSLTTGLGAGGHAEGDTLEGIANLTGSASSDTLEGNDGNNVLAGGANGAQGDTVSYANAAAGVAVNLSLTGSQNTLGSGVDTLTGFENLNGSAHADTLTGNGGANVLSGGAGNDALRGNSGGDTLIGGMGDDTLTGGAGADTFVFNLPSEGIDSLTDFASGTDSIQVSASGFGGNLVAGAPATLLTVADLAGVSEAGSDGYFIHDNAGADAGTVYWDVTGEDAADAVVIARLQPSATLQATDFTVV
jgi:Ca2+-binding RTX toxin-like protein